MAFRPHQAKTYLRTCAKCAGSDHLAHAQRIIRAFAIHSQILLYSITQHHENIYNFDPLKPQFYIVKLGFTGYTLFFIFKLKT